MEKYVLDELTRFAQKFNIDIGVAKFLVSGCGDDLACIERKLENYAQIRKLAEITNGKASLKDAVTRLSANKNSMRIKP